MESVEIPRIPARAYRCPRRVTLLQELSLKGNEPEWEGDRWTSVCVREKYCARVCACAEGMLCIQQDIPYH